MSQTTVTRVESLLLYDFQTIRELQRASVFIYIVVVNLFSILSRQVCKQTPSKDLGGCLFFFFFLVVRQLANKTVKEVQVI